MAAITHICTHCGYEGKPIKPPSDDTDGAVQSDSSKALARVGNLILPGLGSLIRPVAMLVSLPIYLLLWPIKRKLNGPKHCPNCGLPLMVRLNSDAGWLAKRKLDIKMGLIVIDEEGNAKPGTGVKELLPIEAMPKPDPGKLAAVDETVWETTPEQVKETVEEPVVKPVTKKPVNPDEW